MGEIKLNETIVVEELGEILARRTKSGLYGGNGQGAMDKAVVQDSPMLSSIVQGFDTAPPDEWPDEAGVIPQNRIGLAISGGGIRSATFGLGVLQYLGGRGLYRMFDYLSTVSGGGFLGSCLTSWYTSFTGLLKEKEVPEFPFVHSHDQEESVPFQHLRNFSNYLAPKGDLLDNMRMVAIFIRGVMINLLLVLPYVLLAAAALIPMIDYLGTKFNYTTATVMVIGIALLLSTIIFSMNTAQIKWKTRNEATRDMGVLLLILASVFFAELQPWMLIQFHKIYLALQELGVDSGNAVGSLGGLSGLAYFLVDKLKAGAGEKKGIPLSQYAVLAIAILVVPLFFWGLLLFLMHEGMTWTETLVSSTMPVLKECTDACKTLKDCLCPEGSGAVKNIIYHAEPISLFSFGYIGSAVVLFLLGLFFNINRYSMHVFYRDRLSRAYLIAPRSKERWPRERPTFNDTMKLSELNFDHAPYHLINAAVNVTSTDDAEDGKDGFVNRGRTADFFLFSKHWVGSELTGYCDTKAMEKADPWLSLGTAMAISGAAFSPNMGVFTIKPITALMTFFNVRLGYWLPNPFGFQAFNKAFPFDCRSEESKKVIENNWNQLKSRDQKFFKYATKGFWHPPRKYLFNEAFSSLSVDKDAFINVSDGGHIENLAIYPLLQRRCRLIIALDGEADPSKQYEGLAATIRLARINLNVHVDMDREDMNKLCEGRQHWVRGDIWYDNVRKGTLIYIKASLCGQEDLTLQHYKSCHPLFPHESTADQFFDEEQFEAYRSLGFHVAKEVFGDVTSRGGVMPGGGVPKDSACNWIAH